MIDRIFCIRWCAKCDRETVSVGIFSYPRRCPICGRFQQIARRVGEDLEELSW